MFHNSFINTTQTKRLTSEISKRTKIKIDKTINIFGLQADTLKGKQKWVNQKIVKIVENLKQQKYKPFSYQSHYLCRFVVCFN